MEPRRLIRGERLQKLIAAAGLASRREAEGWIEAGRVSVDGAPARLGQRVEPDADVRLDGRALRLGARRAQAARRDALFLCHRSPGEELMSGIGARLPGRASARRVAVSPMPRPDGGLELIALDGDLAARLQRAMRAAACEFSVRVRGALDEAQLERIADGELDDGSQLAVQCVAPAVDAATDPAAGEGGTASNRWYQIAATGASGRQVRQLFERQGCVVSRVLRLALGPLRLTRELPRGRFRPATEAELVSLGVEALPRDAARGRSEQRDVGARQRLRRRKR